MLKKLQIVFIHIYLRCFKISKQWLRQYRWNYIDLALYRIILE